MPLLADTDFSSKEPLYNICSTYSITIIAFLGKLSILGENFPHGVEFFLAMFSLTPRSSKDRQTELLVRGPTNVEYSCNYNLLLTQINDKQQTCAAHSHIHTSH